MSFLDLTLLSILVVLSIAFFYVLIRVMRQL